MEQNDFVEITLEDNRISFRPALPEVRAGFDPLKTTVKWESDHWMAVRIYGFEHTTGEKLEMKIGEAIFLRSEGQTVQSIEFKHPAEEDCIVKYWIDFLPRDSETPLTIDPVVLLRKPRP
jgi:hypothetical protein